MIVFQILKISLSVNHLVAHWIFLIFQILFIVSSFLWKELFSHVVLKNVIGDIIIIIIKVKVQLMLSMFRAGYAAIQLESGVD